MACHSFVNQFTVVVFELHFCHCHQGFCSGQHYRHHQNSYYHSDFHYHHSCRCHSHSHRRPSRTFTQILLDFTSPHHSHSSPNDLVWTVLHSVHRFSHSNHDAGPTLQGVECIECIQLMLYSLLSLPSPPFYVNTESGIATAIAAAIAMYCNRRQLSANVSGWWMIRGEGGGDFLAMF
jgi:hypothetical protein